MATTSKAQNRPLSSRADVKYPPANTPSLKPSRRRDNAAEAESLDLVSRIHDTTLDPDFSPIMRERVLGAVGGTDGIFQLHDQRTIGLVGKGDGVRWLD